MESLEEVLKRELGTTVLESTGKGGGGCISEGSAYKTDSGIVFAKLNKKQEALQMFEGEFESLLSIQTTNTVKVPKPIKVLKNPDGGAVLVMEYLDIQSLSNTASKLGEQMARLHLHNLELGKTLNKNEQSIHKGKYSGYSPKFGFPIPTCCGILPQSNTWSDSWPDFFARKIDQHVKWAQEKYGDREIGSIWSLLAPNLHKMFSGLTIEPALLHGDLWGGNAGQVDGEPVVFDPAAFYGHSEYDLAISRMFGGFGSSYFSAYHSLIPKEMLFEDRSDLYQMFHYFNHWNHFGGGYKSSTISLMKGLANKYK